MDALAPLPNDDDFDDPDADAGKQRSLTEHVNPVDWLVAKNWGTLTIVASYTPADITFPADLKLLNESRESTERIMDNLRDQWSDLRKHRPRYARGMASAAFLNVAKQMKLPSGRIKAGLRRQLVYLKRILDAMIASGAEPSGLSKHRWRKLVISELSRQQSILLYSKTGSMPNRIVNLV
jgi:IS5 family transposase